MTIQFDIAAKPLGRAKVEVTLVAYFVAARVEPGIEQRIGCRLVLFVRGNVDGAIGIEIVVGTHRNTASTQVGTGIGHRRVDGVAAKETMVSTEDLEAAAEAGTNILSLGGKDKEDIIDARFPAIDLLGMRDFFLYLSITDGIAGVGCCIHKGGSKNGFARETATGLGILYVVVVQLGRPDIFQVACEQAIIVG